MPEQVHFRAVFDLPTGMFHVSLGNETFGMTPATFTSWVKGLRNSLQDIPLGAEKIRAEFTMPTGKLSMVTDQMQLSRIAEYMELILDGYERFLEDNPPDML